MNFGVHAFPKDNCIMIFKTDKSEIIYKISKHHLAIAKDVNTINERKKKNLSLYIIYHIYIYFFVCVSDN